MLLAALAIGGIFEVAAGVFRDCVDDLMASGLIHDSASLCDRCAGAKDVQTS